MRLIDADNLVSICEIMADKTDSPQMWEQLISMIESVPTIGAEPVTMRTDNLEFIEINELKKDVEKWRKRARRVCPLRNVNRIPIRELYEILEGLPIAKGELLRTQGHWAEINDGGWAGGGYLKCSACGYGVSWDLSDAADLKYCPYCGARMGEEE